MYSQSKGRTFSLGQQEQLLEYLVQTCPLHPGEDWEEDKKLNLILSKVQEHQSSLRSTETSVIIPNEGWPKMDNIGVRGDPPLTPL